MNITVSLPDELGRQLLARARRKGLNVAEFMAQIVQREAKQPVTDETLISASVNWQEKAEKLRQAMAWLKTHRAEYAGQWVCLDGDLLISHGREAKSVYAEADAKKITSPFVEYIGNDNLPFGGW